MRYRKHSCFPARLLYSPLPPSVYVPFPNTYKQTLEIRRWRRIGKLKIHLHPSFPPFLVLPPDPFTIYDVVILSKGWRIGLNVSNGGIGNDTPFTFWYMAYIFQIFAEFYWALMIFMFLRDSMIRRKSFSLFSPAEFKIVWKGVFENCPGHFFPYQERSRVLHKS